jgi:predicted amidohydrolase
MRDIRVAAVQMEHIAGDRQANFAKIEAFARDAAAQAVEILVLPECCITGYWFLRNLSRDQLQSLAERVPAGESTQRLLRLSKQHNMTIGAGLIEIDESGRMYNSYVVAMPDGKHHVHRKIHAFESDFISAGDTYTVFDTPHGCRVGVLICYDNNIAENARLTALQGAEILLAPHQTGGCDSASPHAMKPVDKTIWNNRQRDPKALEAEFRGPKGREWLMRWLPARAHDNGMFLIFSNGVGVDDDEIRTGNAMVLDPYGRIINETAKYCDDLVVADLKAELLDKCTGRRWMRARRPELYGPIAQPTDNEAPTRKVRFEQ